jgi:protein-disulfide isomerase
MNKVTGIIIAALVLLFGGVVVWTVSTREPVDPTQIMEASEKNGEIGDHVSGNPGNEIAIVEYADPGCSHCAEMQTVMTKLVEDYGDRVAFIKRHFLLGGAYKNSMAAASAIEAAGLQGLYEEMNNIVFANQATWFNVGESARISTFSSIFQSIGGVDVDKFVKDMSSDTVKKKVNFDDSLGRKQGVNGTPTFYYNGVKLGSDDMKDEASFRAYLDKILKEKGLATGAKQDESESSETESKEASEAEE